jgi:hypothetical protein
MAEKIMSITSKGLKKTVELALASQLDPTKKDIADIKTDLREFKTEMRMEGKDIKSEMRNFNSRLDFDRRMTVMEAELKEVKRKVGQGS